MTLSRTLKNIALSGLFIVSLIWAAVAPGLQALIPTIVAIASGIGLIDTNSDYIQNY